MQRNLRAVLTLGQNLHWDRINELAPSLRFGGDRFIATSRKTTPYVHILTLRFKEACNGCRL